jgi:hypothetical protein
LNAALHGRQRTGAIDAIYAKYGIAKPAMVSDHRDYIFGSRPMPLSDDQRDSIREEEQFRLDVRRELAGPPVPPHSPTLLERISAFFETKAGFWILTTVLAGLAATGFSTLQRFLDRDEIAQRETAERARRDMETVLKLGPLLTSDKRNQVDMAIVLLDGLASDLALDARVAAQVRSLVQATLASGLKHDASVEEQAQAKAIIAFADRSRASAIQQADIPGAAAAPKTALSTAIDNAALPVRVYLQIGSGSSPDERASAERLREAIQAARLIAPGIEVVPESNAPQHNDLRYCEGKVDPAALGRVQAVADQAVSPAPTVVVLAPRLCANVGFNRFELWLARRGG